MDADKKQRINELKEDILNAMEEVGGAIESGELPQQLRAGETVEQLVRRYSELTADLIDSERAEIERGLGRRLTDLRRQASQLSQRQTGAKAERAADAGREFFVMQRAPGRWLTAETGSHKRGAARYNVGGELEAWCGKCKELRTHHIVALVDGEPKQVVCLLCKSRHGYRTEPTARSAPAPKTGTSSSSRGPIRDPQAQRQLEQRQKLEQELLDANAYPFNPKAVFKSGQVIIHPTYGRGKIETVLKGSVLVRFLDGRRQISRT